MAEPSPSTLLQVLEGLQENMKSMQENMISMQENMEKGMSDLKGEVKGLSSRIDGLDTRIGKLEGEVKTLRQESSEARGAASERYIRHQLEKQYGKRFAERYVIHGLVGIARLVVPEKTSYRRTDSEENIDDMPDALRQLNNAENIARSVLQDKNLRETLTHFLRQQLLPDLMPHVGDLDLERVMNPKELAAWVAILKKVSHRVFLVTKEEAPKAKTTVDGSKSTAGGVDTTQAKETADDSSAKTQLAAGKEGGNSDGDKDTKASQNNYGKKISWFLAQVEKLINCRSLSEKLNLMTSNEGIGLALLMLCQYNFPRTVINKKNAETYSACIVRTIEMDIRGMQMTGIDQHGRWIMLFSLGEIKSSWRNDVRQKALAQLDKQATALELAAKVLHPDDHEKKYVFKFKKTLYVPSESYETKFQQDGLVTVEFL